MLTLRLDHLKDPGRPNRRQTKPQYSSMKNKITCHLFALDRAQISPDIRAAPNCHMTA